MSSASRAMRRLSAQLVGNLRPPAENEDVTVAVGQALGQVRGRPVRLHKAVFPPATVSGLWVDRTSHDLIVYEENTDPEHQLVIIGHEAWHMFQGHGGSGTAHGTAARTGDTEAGALAELAARVFAAADTELSPGARMDIALHFAARAETRQIDEEVEAERFGFRFATDVRTALAETRAPVDPHDLAGRIQASMAHRFRRN
ncbi:toxin-antitoxin system, toxin component [Streptomyces sp. NPDC052043]|uniref:toxin-antitoxin system, toxin component n=1 Tax=Streptomyces sp. NPDC052043 TaxID=3365684 RepID=UPI0037D2F779